MSEITEALDWLEKLVAFPTISSQSNLALIDFVEAYLREHGAETWRVASDDNEKSNLYAVIGPRTEGGVVLSGHTDVVPVEGQDWTSDPWTLTTRGDRVFGRGTCDMKAFAAIGLSLVPEMVRANLKRPIIFALSYDEEIGCIGAPRMIREIKEHLPRPSAVIVGEPTMMKVVDGHKGIASFRTTVTGFTTHSSQVGRGVSAVEAAAKLIGKIVSLREAAERAAPADSPFDPAFTTLTSNVVRGGTQLNIMAGECVFDWDCRVVPGESAADYFEAFEDFARGVQAEMRTRAASCRIDTVQMTNVPPLTPSPDNEAANLAKALSGHNGTEVAPYAAEAGQFQEAGFPTVICGPGSIDQAHQADEYIALDQIALGKSFIEKLIARLSV